MAKQAMSDRDFNDQYDTLEHELKNDDDPCAERIGSIMTETGLTFTEIFKFFHKKRSQKRNISSRADFGAALESSTSVPTPEIPLLPTKKAYSTGAELGWDNFSFDNNWPHSTSYPWPIEAQGGDSASNEVGSANPQTNNVLMEALHASIGDARGTALLSPPHKKPRNCKGGIYPCLSCEDSFSTIKGWQDHQDRIHFPKLVFICGMKSKGSYCNKITLRRDNFVGHLRRMHEVDSPNRKSLISEIDKWSVPVQDFYHDVCGFCEEERELTSRSESMSHVIGHMESLSRIKSRFEVEYIAVAWSTN